jgi:hypothetical protein
MIEEATASSWQLAEMRKRPFLEKLEKKVKKG